MIRVLVVEDEQVAADALRQYVERVPGFAVVGVARTCAEAQRVLDGAAADLILLDFYLPDGSGLHLLRTLRARGHTADVIAVTSARDLALVREGVSLGIVQHLLKPFVFATLRDRMELYACYHDTTATGEAASQDEVDRTLAALRTPQPAVLPKGLTPPTLHTVTAALQSAAGGLTAGEAAIALGISRITARRYLEHLVDTGRAERAPRYGHPGRPEIEYRWKRPADPAPDRGARLRTPRRPPR